MCVCVRGRSSRVGPTVFLNACSDSIRAFHRPSHTYSAYEMLHKRAGAALCPCMERAQQSHLRATYQISVRSPQGILGEVLGWFPKNEVSPCLSSTSAEDRAPPPPETDEAKPNGDQRAPAALDAVV